MYRSIDSKWFLVICFVLRGCRDYFNCTGGGSRFKRCCLLLQLKLPADRAFLNNVASIATLDILFSLLRLSLIS